MCVSRCTARLVASGARGDVATEYAQMSDAAGTQTSAQTLCFQPEVKQLLRLMIHSLYSHKEIFLRELISNASDACDKLRFKALADPQLLQGDGEFAITIDPDEQARTITIADNGIGMS